MLKAHLVNNIPPGVVTEKDPLTGIETQALAHIGGNWVGKEPVDLRVGRKYDLESKTYTFIGLLRRDDVRNFIYGGDIIGGKAVKLTPDEAKEKYVIAQTSWAIDSPVLHKGDENPDFLYAFRSGDSFLVASTSRGMRPIEPEQKVIDIGETAREVISQSPFQKHMTPEGMVEAAQNLGLNVGDAVLLIEPVDPHFPVALALSKLRVAASSMNMEVPEAEKPPDAPLEDTRDRTQIELLASELNPRIMAAGGALLTLHPIQLVDATPGQFAAAAVNGLDDLPADLAKALMTVVLKTLSANSRLLVSKKDPAKTDQTLIGAAEDIGVTLKKLRDGIRYDVPEDATLYEVTSKRVQSTKA